jgi:hypothetical protein
MTKYIAPGTTRFMDRAWLRDNEIIYTGEALALAMLVHVKKGRDSKREEQFKDLMGVVPSEKAPNNRRGRRKPRKPKV